MNLRLDYDMLSICYKYRFCYFYFWNLF